MFAALTGSGASAQSASAATAGLVDTTLPAPASNPLSSPTAIAPILDSGRALVLEKGGAVRVLQSDGTQMAGDALTLNVCTDSEEGLLGAAVDPGFASNGFVYLYYTRNAGNCASSSGRFNRVSRFKMTGDTIEPASEVVLLDNMNIPAGNHNGGDLHIGNDGDLYVSVGDGGTNPRGSGSSAAQDLSLLNGKILRITTSGAVPPDNPFVGAPEARSCATAGISAPTTAKCTEIYDYGLRNPFRFAFDPNTDATRFYINDVGQSTWEEVDAGGSGLNYGWDSREGFCNMGS
jgi:glucose/arabinose dehydrogenase